MEALLVEQAKALAAVVEGEVQRRTEEAMAASEATLAAKDERIAALSEENKALEEEGAVLARRLEARDEEVARLVAKIALLEEGVDPTKDGRTPGSEVASLQDEEDELSRERLELEDMVATACRAREERARAREAERKAAREATREATRDAREETDGEVPTGEDWKGVADEKPSIPEDRLEVAIREATRERKKRKGVVIFVATV